MNKLKNATVKATGEKIVVHRWLSTELWVNNADGHTEYYESDLEFE